MFTIDFTKPFLYKDIIYFNQGNLAANNILRCKLVTGGDETLEGYIATVTFKTLSHAEINESVNIVDAKNCIVDIKFPSNALEVGVNELEVILAKGEGIDKVVTPSPIIKYEVWQCITTGNGIQGDSNYPILIDLINDVNNAVRIANNASATADASLKQTAKMLDVVNTNISKANEVIDNTNSAKDEALNAVEEVNVAKNSMIEDVNSTKNTVVADVNQAKNDMEITVDEAIKFLKQEFNSLTAQQQEELEVLQARDGEVNLNARLERDLAKGKMHWETVEGSYISTDDTLDSYLQNIKIKGNTIQNHNNLADIKSVGDKVEGQELYRIPIVCCGKNLFDKNNPSLVKKAYASSNGELINNDNYNVNIIKCTQKENIFISFIKGDGIDIHLTFWNDDTFISGDILNVSKLVITPNSCNNIRVSYHIGLTDIQVERDTQATSYNPYKEHKITILSPTQVEKVGNVTDRIIEKDGVWGVEKRTYDWTLDSNTTVRRGGKTPGNLYVFNIIKDCNDSTVAICNYLPFIKNWTSSTPCFYTQTTDIVFMIDEDITLDEFKSRYVGKLTFKLVAENSQFIPLPHSQQIKLKTFANKTNISFLTEIEGTIKADVAKSISASVNSNTQEISDLWDFVLKNNLANFAVALNALDTKLRLEQLTKAPR